MDLYAENILDHYKHPRNTGELKAATVSHREENLSCGDDLTLDLKLAGGKIAELAWRGNGCAISQAAMSLLSEELIGKTIAEAEKIGKDEILEMLGVPVGPRRLKCALLGLHTLQNALCVLIGKKAEPWSS